MKISGAATVHAPASQVWAALTDPAVLVATIPGCERLEQTGPDRYALTVTAGVAAIQGTYAGEFSLSDRVEPVSLQLTASGSGSPGTVRSTVAVRLDAAADGATELRYDADAQIGGMIAGVGQRMLASVAKRMAGEFFASVDDVLAGRAVPGQAGPGQAVPGQAVPAQRGPGQPVPGQGAPAAQPVPAAAAPAAYLAPPRAAAAGPQARGFLLGVLAGGMVALAGVAVGARIGGRAGRR
ncbi:MAG: SRPBCC family protein [Streptosporangiaceae bacterium]